MQAADLQRSLALEKWHCLIELQLESSSVGRQLLRENNALRGAPEIHRILADFFEPKATRTLLKRAGPLARYVAWHRAEFSTPVWPLMEDRVYQYLCHARDSGEAATMGDSFMKAVAFARFVLGLDGADAVQESARIRGVVRALFLRKRVLMQRPPLTVVQVSRLEQILLGGERLEDRVAAGAFLLAIYSRCRWSDLQQIESLESDFAGGESFATAGFLEARVRRTKTANSLLKKTTYLPIVAPACGITAPCWGSVYLQLREEAGLEFLPGAAVLPMPRPHGGFSERPATSALASRWLRGLLALQADPQEDLGALGTHSCKATALSWCSKAAVDVATRRLLGYHCEPGARMALCYSRDAQSGPLRELCRVLDMIKGKQFFPDSTRSGYFMTGEADGAPHPTESPEEEFPGDLLGWEEVPLPDSGPPLAGSDRGRGVGGDSGERASPCRAEPWVVSSEDEPLGPPPVVASRPGPSGDPEEHLAEQAEPGEPPSDHAPMGYKSPSPRELPDGWDNTSVSSVDSVLSEAHSQVEADEAVAEEVTGRLGPGPSRHLTSRLYRHPFSRVVHAERRGEPSKTAWGRPLTPSYCFLGKGPAFPWPQCRICFGWAADRGERSAERLEADLLDQFVADVGRVPCLPHGVGVRAPASSSRAPAVAGPQPKRFAGGAPWRAVGESEA